MVQLNHQFLTLTGDEKTLGKMSTIKEELTLGKSSTPNNELTLGKLSTPNNELTLGKHSTPKDELTIGKMSNSNLLNVEFANKELEDTLKIRKMNTPKFRRLSKEQISHLLSEKDFLKLEAIVKNVNNEFDEQLNESNIKKKPIA